MYKIALVQQILCAAFLVSRLAIQNQGMSKVCCKLAYTIKLVGNKQECNLGHCETTNLNYFGESDIFC